MSATVYWRPEEEGTPLSTGSAREFLEKVPPGRYGPKDVDYLRGLAAMGLEGAQEVIDAIERHEYIIITAEH